jgi:hypothetical protein
MHLTNFGKTEVAPKETNLDIGGGQRAAAAYDQPPRKRTESTRKDELGMNGQESSERA